MKRALILCLFLIMSENLGECATTLFPPLQPLQSMNSEDSIQNYSSNISSLADPFANPAPTQNINYSDVNRIEQSLFGHTFANQNISMRLSRIEKTLFTTTYPNSSNIQRIDNIISNFNQMNKYPNISKNELSKMESRILGQSFSQSNAETRIERLEQQIFGAVQSGDLNSRYETLKLAAKTYNKNTIYSPDNIAQATRGGWKGMIGDLGNSFLGGTMTGFTPPINPYNGTYNNGYNRYNNYNSYANPYTSGYGMYKGYRTNHGYYDGFKDYSSGTGVTILD